VYFSDGNSAVWDCSSPDFKQVEKLAKNSEWVAIEAMHNKAKMLLQNEVTLCKNDLCIKKDDGKVVKLNLDASDDYLFKFIKLLREKGVIDTEIIRIKPFLENMFKNPFINAVHEIYDFCTKMDFEITDDGCFLAYKNVRSDLGSIHDGGKTKHAIGEYTEVEAFDTDRNQTCSKGLHFCSRNYLRSYPGDVTIIVKVNPMDVVAIPTDYNFEKGRCRKYMTVGILKKNTSLSETDIGAMSNGTVKTVKTATQKILDKNKIAMNRIEETAMLMKKFKNNVVKVAKTMHISVSTVKRNMRKYRAGKKNENVV
jgi:hypothetical protein